MNEKDKKILAEIEMGEAWFSSTMQSFPEPYGELLENLKFRLRIEVQEKQLLTHDADTVSPETISNVKLAVRDELRQRTVVTKRPEKRLIYFGYRRGFLGGLAAAAVLAICVTPVFWTTEHSERNGSSWIFEDFETVLASPPTTELDDEFAELSTDLDEFSDSLLVLPGNYDEYSSEIEAIGDELDGLLTDDTFLLEI